MCVYIPMNMCVCVYVDIYVECFLTSLRIESMSFLCSECTLRCRHDSQMGEWLVEEEED